MTNASKLTRRFGPFPVWLWALILGFALLLAVAGSADAIPGFAILFVLGWGAVALIKRIIRGSSKKAGKQGVVSVSTVLHEGEAFGNSWDYGTEVVGESNYQPALKVLSAQGKRDEIPMVLVPEPDNKYDKNAVAVFSPTGLIGYLPREHAAEIQADLMAEQKSNGGNPISVYGRLVGGTEGKSLGVYLAMPKKWS